MSHGGSHAPRRALSRRLRTGLVFVALGALVVPMAYVFGSYWTVTGQDRSLVAAERRAVGYLKPLVRLVGTLADAQVAAVDARSVDAEKLRAALTTVDAVDRRDGAALGARQRWSKLRSDIEATLAKNPQGQPAYQSYNDLTTPALALVAKVSETSGLASDPEFEAHSTLLRLPGVIVHSGQITTLLRDPSSGAPGGHHGGGHGASNAANDHAGKAPAATAVQVAVALDKVSTAREAIREGLRRSEGATVTDADALQALDELSAAVDALARVAGPAAEGGSVPPDDADEAGERVRRAALAFHDRMLAALDSQLADREDALGDQRLAAALAMVTGLLLAAVLLWFSLPGRPQPEAGEPDAHRAVPSPSPMPAADLFAGEELLHVGRAVRPVRGEPGDDAR